MTAPPARPTPHSSPTPASPDPTPLRSRRKPRAASIGPLGQHDTQRFVDGQ